MVSSSGNKLEKSSSVEVVELVTGDDEETFDKLHAVGQNDAKTVDDDESQEETFNSLYETRDVEKTPEATETPPPAADILCNLNSPTNVVNFDLVRRRRNRRGYETVILPGGDRVRQRAEVLDSPAADSEADNSATLTRQDRKYNGDARTAKAMSVDVTDFSAGPHMDAVSVASHGWARSASNISLPSFDVDAEDDSVRR